MLRFSVVVAKDGSTRTAWRKSASSCAPRGRIEPISAVSNGARRCSNASEMIASRRAADEFGKRPNVCSGSKPVLAAPKRHFRSTPNNGHHQTAPAGPFRAVKQRARPGRGLCGSLTNTGTAPLARRGKCSKNRRALIARGVADAPSRADPGCSPQSVAACRGFRVMGF